LFYALSRHVEQSAAERVHPVFLLDESHLLHQDTLDHLHILLNYAWDSRALLSLILVGLPELRERLALRRNRSLYSRIHHRLEIASTRSWRSIRSGARLENEARRCSGTGSLNPGRSVADPWNLGNGWPAPKNKKASHRCETFPFPGEDQGDRTPDL